MDFLYGAELRRQVSERLDAFTRSPLDDDTLRAAAVALVIVGGGDDGEASLLLTRRPTHLNRHGGQFALPGGRVDDGETLVDAALRELDEELGLTLGSGDVLGRLDDYPTRSGFRISPIVMWGGENPALNPDPNEVARIFHIPFHELDSPALPNLIDSDAGDHPIMSVPLPATGGLVYAPTAAMIYQFREVALRGAATRVSHFDQPQFAWS
ncbi:MAG: CoA pyrophosphatase [Rhodospirillaceae bacterium]|nr:CoA pyrophosphatase [Rhodospirillaceae bacterium]